MRKYLIVALLFAVTLAAGMTGQTVAQTATRSLMLGQSERMVFLNKSGSTLYRKDPVQIDTTEILLHSTAFVLPDTFTADSFSTVIDSTAAVPFILKYRMNGFESSDTIEIYGTTLTSLRWPFGSSNIDTTTLSFVPDDSNGIVSGYYWTDVWALYGDTAGSGAGEAGPAGDSITFYIEHLMAVTDADSLEDVETFVGVVGADSIQDDSLGYVIVDGPAFVKLNGDNTIIEPYDFLTVGTSGFVKAANVAKDTIYNQGAGATGTQLDSFYLRRTIVGRALQRTTTSQDSGWIRLIRGLW